MTPKTTAKYRAGIVNIQDVSRASVVADGKEILGMYLHTYTYLYHIYKHTDWVMSERARSCLLMVNTRTIRE